jgi:hypothetical protein
MIERAAVTRKQLTTEAHRYRQRNRDEETEPKRFERIMKTKAAWQ